jgi:hypothetical protein
MSLFMRTPIDLDVKRGAIAELRERATALRNSVLPKGVSCMEIDVHGCVVCVVDLYRPIQRVGEFWPLFTGAVENELATCPGSVKLKDLGLTSFLCFNMLKSGKSLRDAARDSVVFCRNLQTQLNEKQLHVRFGIASAESAKACLISEHHLVFDLYHKAMETAYSLARHADAGTILLPLEMAPFLTTADTAKLTNAEFSMGGLLVSNIRRLAL